LHKSEKEKISRAKTGGYGCGEGAGEGARGRGREARNVREKRERKGGWRESGGEQRQGVT